MVTGIILAGGKSIRMGSDKANMPFNGKTLLQCVIDNISPLCNEILISTDNDSLKTYGLNIVHDAFKNAGPVGGILSGLKASSNEYNLVISCDMPLAGTVFLEEIFRLSVQYKITVIRHLDRLHPLCAIYPRFFLPDLKRLYETGERKLQHILRRFDLNILTQDIFPEFSLDFYLKNFNTREEILKFETENG